MTSAIGIKKIQHTNGTQSSVIDSSGDMLLQGTGKLRVPSGTTAQSTANTNGDMRYNSTINKFDSHMIW